ncbi:hypothetical protein L804_05998 [Cryptococcus deuterogattii 2001/935-1]|nr:hypothetical protein L804_05998 [Cryptococcus deuterogattii 2001/935-1]
MSPQRFRDHYRFVGAKQNITALTRKHDALETEVDPGPRNRSGKISGPARLVDGALVP